ncbi:PSP1-domain-containing protein [Piromyces finnis]|uniref:PSP1-domain-containing protein n=1 Tax=Piromyces finnis TaxID=1754191 RepID=A0A1Y1VLU5_9FUNG|nr:PSP1-domain-containing protein [Piromyces finnis]|eukprot:ORX59904.1 PSP1-domain-containing protein [Piromyces finnis]
MNSAGNNNTANGGEASSNDEVKKALSNQGSDYVNEIDDYFENTEHRTRAWVEAGKNLQNQQSSQHWPLYIVEFKAGRTDYFYISEKSGLVVKVNDLVIVEADRGKDLGKVVASNITSYQQIQAYQAQHTEEGMEIQKDIQIHPKRIYRLAQKAEIDMLISKCQDEVKAKNLCQTKVRQKKLPMEIVDAEFQWDRKKLTFYFVSDRRIDFRELVRELFKIYKTRIW